MGILSVCHDPVRIQGYVEELYYPTPLIDFFRRSFYARQQELL